MLGGSTPSTAKPAPRCHEAMASAGGPRRPVNPGATPPPPTAARPPTRPVFCRSAPARASITTPAFTQPPLGLEPKQTTDTLTGHRQSRQPSGPQRRHRRWRGDRVGRTKHLGNGEMLINAKPGPSKSTTRCHWATGPVAKPPIPLRWSIDRARHKTKAPGLSSPGF